MIHGDASHDEGMRGLLRRAEFVLFLTGSRYFGNATKDADWDFFTEYHPDIAAWLKAKGFRQIKSASSYKDSQVMEVWRFGGPVITYDQANERDHESYTTQIDVQLVRDATIKESAQAYIFSHPTLFKKHNKMEKWERSQLWDFVFAAMHGIKYEGALNQYFHWEDGKSTARGNNVELVKVLSEF